MVSRIPLYLSFFVSLLGGFCAERAAAKDIASAVLVDREGRMSGRLSITVGPAPETSTLKTVIGYEESVDGIIIEFLDVGKCDFDKLDTRNNPTFLLGMMQSCVLVTGLAVDHADAD